MVNPPTPQVIAIKQKSSALPPIAGNSEAKLGTAAACAVKRIHLDERVARCAARAGAELMEGFEVGTDVTFDKEAGLWTVKSTGVSWVGAEGGGGRQGVVLTRREFPQAERRR